MIAWRITKRAYGARADVLGGEGARAGGRWNRAGLAVVYSSENASLAILETLVRLTERRLPKSLVAVRITIPDGATVTTIAKSLLPRGWQEVDNRECIEIGSEWIESRKSLVLRVPSAANSLEDNLLLNPQHPDIAACSVASPTALGFDPRLISLVRT